MQKYRRGLGVLALVWLASSCAGTAGERVQSAPGATRDILAEAQLAEHTDAYNAVLTLRPTWLRARGPDSIRNPSELQVYRDGTRIGGVETLRDMNTQDIVEIRFYDAAAASLRWGMGHGAGVISITSRVR
jgi:hypothetical protein